MATRRSGTQKLYLGFVVTALHAPTVIASSSLHQRPPAVRGLLLMVHAAHTRMLARPPLSQCWARACTQSAAGLAGSLLRRTAAAVRRVAAAAAKGSLCCC